MNMVLLLLAMRAACVHGVTVQVLRVRRTQMRRQRRLLPAHHPGEGGDVLRHQRGSVHLQQG